MTNTRKYESKMEGDRWWPIVASTTVDGRLVQWMEENGATYVSAIMADGWKFEVRAVGADEAAREATRLAAVASTKARREDGGSRISQSEKLGRRVRTNYGKASVMGALPESR